MGPGGAMPILRRVATWCLLAVTIPVVLGVLGTFMRHPWTYPGGDGPLEKRILVVSNLIHTDIAVPIDPDSVAALGFLADNSQPILHPDARWMLIGWGGRSFYLETPSLADIRPGPTFRALTIDSSVMHVDVLADIDLADPAVTPLAVSEEAYVNLLRTISASFARKDGRVLPIDGYAYGPVDAFYEAEGSFNALLGCNTWTSRVLRSAGVRTGIWNPLPQSLTLSLRMFNDL